MSLKKVCDSKDCTGCATCAMICPKKAITMTENQEGFIYPTIDANECIECKMCIKYCPSNNNIKKNSTSKFFMGWHKNKNVLLSSSSGGAFTALSNYVFQNDGIVFGATQSKNNFEVYHKFIKSEEQLSELRLSKYYQSNLKNTYSEVKDFLNKDKLVLFCGTACQIAGLKLYLKKDCIDNLITVDVLCHGVSSKTIIKSYIEAQESLFKKKIISFDFRVKDEIKGWNNGEGTRMKLIFSDGTEYISEKKYDTFFLGFNNNLFLRESCYNCRYCGINRISDFTLADYWKCSETNISKEQLKLGVSLILSNSSKAHILISELNDMELFEINPNNAINNNKALREPQIRPSIRDDFYSKLKKHNYNKIIEKVFWKRFTKRKIKLFIKKILPSNIYNRIIRNP